MLTGRFFSKINENYIEQNNMETSISLFFCGTRLSSFIPCSFNGGPLVAWGVVLWGFHFYPRGPRFKWNLRQSERKAYGCDWMCNYNSYGGRMCCVICLGLFGSWEPHVGSLDIILLSWIKETLMRFLLPKNGLEAATMTWLAFTIGNYGAVLQIMRWCCRGHIQ